MEEVLYFASCTLCVAIGFVLIAMASWREAEMWAVNYRMKTSRPGSMMMARVFDTELAALEFCKSPPKDVIVFSEPWRL